MENLHFSKEHHPFLQVNFKKINVKWPCSIANIAMLVHQRVCLLVFVYNSMN